MLAQAAKETEQHSKSRLVHRTEVLPGSIDPDSPAAALAAALVK
ncbi:MAG TPA: hypothetical protein VII22_19280 [Streptosporangiaceae bacterium]